MFIIAFILALTLSTSSIHPTIIPVRAQESQIVNSQTTNNSDYTSKNKYLDTDYYQEVTKPQIAYQALVAQQLLEQENLKKAQEAKALEDQLKVLRQQQALEEARQLAIAQAQQNSQILVVGNNQPIDLQARISYWCSVYGCDSNQLVRVMYCESGGKPNSSNGSVKGLFQHEEAYWKTRSARVGLAGASIWDPEAQIKVTAYMFANGQASHWKNCL